MAILALQVEARLAGQFHEKMVPLLRRMVARPAPVAPSESIRVEHVLATARCVLALTSLAVLSFQAVAPSHLGRLSYALCAAYAIHALLTAAHLRSGKRVSDGLRLFIHAVDVVSATCLAVLIDSPNHLFFVFFVFIILAAAYRWSLREALVTALISLGALVIEGIVLSAWPEPPGEPVGADLALNLLVTRGGPLLLTAGLLGYLAEGEKKLRAETSVIARIMSQVQASTGLTGSIQAVIGELVQLFGTTRVLLAARDVNTGRILLWEAGQERGGRTGPLTRSEDDGALQNVYFFPMLGQAWHATRRRTNARDCFKLVVLDEQGTGLRGARFDLPSSFQALHPFRTVFCFASNFREEWSCRLFLFNPRIGVPPETGVHFLQTLALQVGPALYNVYLVRGLRARASQIERGRLTRELHDGTVQSLIGLEMQLDVLRRRLTGDSGLGDALARIQNALRSEVLTLRELMQQVRALDLDPKHLVDFLAERVERFQRETGIAAEFVCELEEVDLTPRVCREIARIVQEALVNIRKHSAAKNVRVQLAFEDGYWLLVIDDDGRGFSFSGRVSQSALDATNKGPLVIKERVRSINGLLTIESNSGRGARMEVLIPHASHAGRVKQVH